MKKEFLESVFYLKTLIFKYKWLFISIVLIFLFGFLFSFTIPNELKIKFLAGISEKFSKFSSDPEKLFYQIFLNNLSASFISLISGFLLILPLIMVFLNGFILGIVFDFSFRLSSLNNSYSIFLISLLSILPHGIIEIPTLIINVFLSFLLGVKLFKTREIELKDSRKKFTLKIFKIFIFVIVPLILLAAFLESYVTDYVVKNVNSTLVKNKEGILNSVILNAEDLKAAGVKVNEIKDKSQTIESNWLLVRQNVSYVYDNDTYKMHKRIKKEHMIYRLYAINEKENLAIQIYKLKSNADTVEQIKANRQVIKSLSKTGKTKINYLGNDLYKLNYSNTFFYIKFMGIDKYVFFIRYDGRNTRLFNKIINLQADKIKTLGL